MDPDFHKMDTLLDVRPLQNKRNASLPEKIGPYKIESLLHVGGMSQLYLGLDPATLQPIAVKVLLPKHLKNKEVCARFLNEAKIIEAAQHPNIVKLHKAGHWEKGVYIAMEFIRGVSLRQFIQQKSFSLKKALEIIHQVASALAHLHAHGVIHRDLKPENILITENGSIKLIDFGISQLQDETDLSDNKRRMGTPFYMSPEQLENPSSVTQLTDIYAIGIIAYELILGRSTHGVIHLSLLPSGLRSIIEKALQINPHLRYQNILDFISDISLYEQELEAKLDQEPKNLSLPPNNSFEYIKSILIPKKGIRSPQVEIAICKKEGIAVGSPYLDFFPLPDNRLVIILAESTHLDAHSLTHTAMLRGMIRMALQTAFQNGKKEKNLIDMLNELNSAVVNDSIKEKFHFNLLYLIPDKNLLSFISCDYTDLWHIEEGSKKVRELSSPNAAIGTPSHTSLIETSDNWNSGDMIIFHSIKKIEKSPQEFFDEIADENRLLTPQQLANKLMENLPTKEDTALLLAIHRIF